MPKKSKKRLKHVLIYDCYAIYQMDNGLFCAESRFADDDLQIWSCIIDELLESLDLIERSMIELPTMGAPQWLTDYIDGDENLIILPSVVFPEMIEAAKPRKPEPLIGRKRELEPIGPTGAAGPSVAMGMNGSSDAYNHPYDIEDDIKKVRLYRNMPSNIARAYHLFDEVKVA